MIELRKSIMKILMQYHDDVYYQHSTDRTGFPYVVYEFPSSFLTQEQETFTLDVDVWDNNNDTTVLETIATDIWRGLHKLHYMDEKVQFTIYRDNRLAPIDDNKSIKRRKLIFELKYFDRKL